MLFACALTGRVIGLTIEVHWLTGPACRNRSTDCHAARSIGVDRWFQYFVWRAVGDTPLGPQKTPNILPAHDVQVLTYLRISGLRLRLRFNVHARLLNDGPRRCVVRTTPYCSVLLTWQILVLR